MRCWHHHRCARMAMSEPNERSPHCMTSDLSVNCLTTVNCSVKDSLERSFASLSSIQETEKRSPKQELMLLPFTRASLPQYEPQDDSVGLEALKPYTPGMFMFWNMLPL